jgi:ribosomal silencing factor RsfS
LNGKSFTFEPRAAQITPMDAKKLALLCRELADHKKAENIVILDVRKLSSVTDYFVIASGTSEPHLRAVTNEIEDRLRADHGLGGAGLRGCHRPRHARGCAGAL